MIPERKMQIEKQKVRSRCGSCQGKRISSCYDCMRWERFIDQMAVAEIPLDYWYRDMKDFYGEANFKDVVLKYMANLDNKFDQGVTYCFAGERGRGKTMAACCILKQALLETFSAYYITLSDFVTCVLGDDANLKRRIKVYDFVVIDEVDQRFFPSHNSMELYGNHLENILRSRMQNHMPTIFCTNSLDIGQIFGGEFKKSFDSLGSQFIKVIGVLGKDVRLDKEKL